MKWNTPSHHNASRMASFRVTATLMVAASMFSACGPELMPEEESQLLSADASEVGLPIQPASMAELAGQASEMKPVEATKQAVGVACNRLPNTGWVNISGPFDKTPTYQRYEFSLVSAMPTFNISDAQVVTNNLSTPSSVSFTSQQSRTFSISATASMQVKLGDFFTASVNSTIQRSHTTLVGVSTTATVPAFGAIRGEYGVRAYNVTYDVRTFEKHTVKMPPFGSTTYFCWDLGVTRMTTNAPTYVEEWRLSPEP